MYVFFSLCSSHGGQDLIPDLLIFRLFSFFLQAIFRLRIVVNCNNVHL